MFILLFVLVGFVVGTVVFGTVRVVFALFCWLVCFGLKCLSASFVCLLVLFLFCFVFYTGKCGIVAGCDGLSCRDFLVLFLYASSVCVLHIQLTFAPIYIQHNQCPGRCLLERRALLPLWSRTTRQRYT